MSNYKRHHMLILTCFMVTASWKLVEGLVSVYDLKANATTGDLINDEPAAFGDEFPDNGFAGWLMVADPPEACEELRNVIPNPPPPNDEYNWILLIVRGGPNGCQFSDKVLRAQEKGFGAAIVYDNQKESKLLQMSGGTNGSKVLIPSVFVSMEDGILLGKFYSSNDTTGRYVIQIKEQNVNLKVFLWPFVIVLGVCLIISVGFLLVKVAIDANRRQRSRLSSKHLKKIPIKRYKKGDYYDTCAICLEEYEDKEKIRVLPCDHVYHAKCIDPWLTKNKKTCPVCKRRVIPRRAQDSSDSDSDAEAGENTPLLSGGAGTQHRGVSINSTAELHIEPDGATASGSSVRDENGPIPQPAEPFLAHTVVEVIPERRRQKRHRTRDSGVTQQPGASVNVDPSDDPEPHGTAVLRAFAQTVVRAQEERRERKRKKKGSKKRRRAEDVVPEERQRPSNDDEEVPSAQPLRDDEAGDRRRKRRGEVVVNVDKTKEEKKAGDENDDSANGATGYQEIESSSGATGYQGDESSNGATGYQNAGFVENDVVHSGRGSRSKKRNLNEVV